jgi:hypothetical protein
VLYAEAAKHASVVLKSEVERLSAAQVLQYIKEIYQYSVDSQLNHIDKNFAAWLASRL